MKNERITNKKYFSYLAVFMIALLPKLYLSLTALPLKTFSDELATISSAAYLAGFDWSQTVSNAGYYGQGFHCLFAPLFMLTDNPVIIYRVVVSVYAVLQAAVAPISYHLMKKYFEISNERFLYPASIACSYLIFTRATLFFNEHILIFCVWIAAWILLELGESLEKPWKKRGLTLLLMLVLAYSLLLHTRALALWIGLIFTVIVYWLKNRKWLVSRSCFLVAGVGGYIGTKKIVESVQSVLWKVGEGQDLINASINLDSGVKWNSLRTWKAWISTILGQLESLNLVTAGIGILCVLIVLVVLWKLFRKEKEKEPVIRHNLLLFLLFGSCAAMTMLGQSFSWLGQMSYGISHGPNSLDYGLKVIIYLRYFAMYLGPVFMGCLCWMEEKKEEVVPLLKWAGIISVFLLAYWIIVLLPFTYENPFTLEFFYSLSAYQTGQPVELKNYMIGFVWMVLGMMLTYTLLKQKKVRWMTGLLALFLMFQYCGNGLRYELNREKVNNTIVDGGYNYVKELEEKEKEVPKQIYCYDGSKRTNHQSFYGYQFVLNRYEIIPVFEEDGSDIPDGAMVFSNVPMNEELMKRGFQQEQLDRNEYVYLDRTKQK